ncbi:MAG TPA: class II aldolase/adducin family protein [Spirochaetales bacterium]|nr:class II aldolase/adducin family protein [Spirochaetales bacterium]
MAFLEKYKDQVEVFISVCRNLCRNTYVTSQGGNLSWKLEHNLILITPTRVNKGEVEPEDLVFINSAGEKIEGKHAPTGETPMYLNFYRKRPDIKTVIHCHPPYTGSFAISKGKNWLMRPIFPETCAEIGPVPVVPYGQPLSQELADNFLPYLQKHNAFLMENHGLVILSQKDIAWAMMITELLETTSFSILHALSLGGVKELSKKDVEKLDEVMATRKLPLFGAPGVNKSLTDLYFP